MLLDGKLVSSKIINDNKLKIINNNYDIGFAIIMIGDNEASKIYVNNKIKTLEATGIRHHLHKLDNAISESEVLELIDCLNKDSSIHGIIVQSPTPNHINFKKCANAINSNKDVDGLGMKNTYLNYLDENAILPCTVKGIIVLLNYYNISIEGKDVVIIGKGNLVGKPLAILMMNLGATVTICHTKTKKLKEKCLNAEILISATGEYNLITSDMVKDNAVVIDVGISRINGKVKGDVDFENVKNKAGYITPVPGGIGPMTIAMIIDNTVTCFERRKTNE